MKKLKGFELGDRKNFGKFQIFPKKVFPNKGLGPQFSETAHRALQDV